MKFAINRLTRQRPVQGIALQGKQIDRATKITQSKMSTAIADAHYDNTTNSLIIQYRGGHIYTYHGVPLMKYIMMSNASSLGRFVNQNIKPFYPFTLGGDL